MINKKFSHNFTTPPCQYKSRMLLFGSKCPISPVSICGIVMLCNLHRHIIKQEMQSYKATHTVYTSKDSNQGETLHKGKQSFFLQLKKKFRMVWWVIVGSIFWAMVVLVLVSICSPVLSWYIMIFIILLMLFHAIIPFCSVWRWKITFIFISWARIVMVWCSICSIVFQFPLSVFLTNFLPTFPSLALLIWPPTLFYSSFMFITTSTLFLILFSSCSFVTFTLTPRTIYSLFFY